MLGGLLKWGSSEMDVYLIAPTPEFGRDTLISDASLNLDERFTLMAAAGIVTVAAFFDPDVNLTLCDELIEDVDFTNPAQIVCISMNVSQARRGIEIAKEFKKMGRTVVMGGAHVSLAPEVFEADADCLVIGEFETSAEEFMRDLRNGALKPRYVGGKADMALSPLPRWDLYRNERVVTGVIQTSRGCPFECHFCDVIQYLGRTQRHKPPEKVIEECQLLYDHGYRNISLSDDNFTVYRKRTRELLEVLAAWNGRDGREPVQFSTQASIDIARDQGIMDLCNEAGVRDIFIGIETNSDEALQESKKRQNLKQDLVKQTQTVVESGIVVSSGMMIGFDSDDLSCFERQFEFGMALPVVTIRVTVLVAPVATPLYATMEAEGRLVQNGNEISFAGTDCWTNIIPKNMTRKQLAEGAIWLVDALFEPDNVIKRFEHVAKLLKPAPEHLRRQSKAKIAGSGVMLKLMRSGAKDPNARRVIDAVNEMTRARPEIAWDLSPILVKYLNTYFAIKRSSMIRSSQLDRVS
ncbi:B12-binding domain-containing radical SAM protein [Roseovarius mucosus]|uniref:radical SAM protein n=1 Tax=Roseovarius TaxID=74030 RepID=UPI00125FCD0F|nr:MULTISPECIES: radical SAM protein [Roseovarius]MBW4973145.1 B12-binding domain-containing radical SAM protein [Roseovarius mucosus]